MNISYLSFYSQYFNSPKTYLHKYNKIYKLYTVFSLLIISTYFPNIYFISIFYIIFFISLSILKIEINDLIFYLYLIYLYLYYYKSLNYNLILYVKNINFYIPYYIKQKYIKNDYNSNKLIILNFYNYIIPLFFIKSIIIHLAYKYFYQILLISTPYEFIAIFFFNLFNSLKKIIKTNFVIDYNFLFILFLLPQFLEKIIHNMYLIYIYLNVRPNNFINIKIFYNLVYKLIKKYINNILYDTTFISINIWNKDIITKNLY